MTKTMPTSSSFMETLSTDDLLPLVVGYLDEESLSSLACVVGVGLRTTGRCSSSGVNELQQGGQVGWKQQQGKLQRCWDQAWINLAVRRCCFNKTSSGDGNKGFVSVAVAKSFLKAQQKRMKAETIVCCNKDCSKPGIARCSSCKVAAYCCRNCQAEDWRRHKSACKILTKKAGELCRVISKENMLRCPWGKRTLGIDRNLTDGEATSPGVFAEYDPNTKEFRSLGSALHIGAALEEKRLHNDGIFLHVVIVRNLWQWASFKTSFVDPLNKAFSEVAQYVPIEYNIMSEDSSPSNPDMMYLAIVRAVEGLLTKTIAPTKDESYNRFMELCMDLEVE